MNKRFCMILASVALLLPALRAEEPAWTTDADESAPKKEYLLQKNGDLYEMLGDSIVRIYRCVFDSQKDRLMKNNPANSIYAGKWVNQWVNPYKIDPATIKDTVLIKCDGAVFPLSKLRQTSPYGWRWGRMHYGVDLGLNTGDTVRTAWAGKVRVVDYDAGGYGNYVVVRHENGLETVYGHLSAQLVVPNQALDAGQVIGLGGSTGRSTGPHLHFETRYLGNAFDVSEIFDFVGDSLKTKDYPLSAATFRRSKSGSSNPTPAATAAAIATTPDAPAAEKPVTAAAQPTYSKPASTYKKPAPVKKPVYHTVKSGENLSVIAARAGTTVSAICKLNGIKPTKLLHPGDKLKVK